MSCLQQRFEQKLLFPAKLLCTKSSEWVSVVKTEECVAAQRAEISTALIVPMLFKSEKKKKKDEPPAATTRTHTRVGARFFHV